MGMFDIIRLLSESEVDYVLVDGLAVALQGYPRTTMDVDVVMAMDADNLRRFIASAKAAGLRPLLPVPIESLAHPELLDEWHREKHDRLQLAHRRSASHRHRHSGSSVGALCRFAP